MLRYIPTGWFFLSLSVVLLVADSAGATGPARVSLASEVVQVPVVDQEGHLMVDVTIGDSGALRFLLDTGAGVEAWVDDALVRQFGLKPIGQAPITDGSHGVTRHRSVVLVEELQLGGVTARGVRAVVADLGWLSDARGLRVDGILGFPLFHELLLTIDYPGQAMELSFGTLAGSAAHVMRYDDSRNVPDIELRVGRHRVKALLDTGARAAMSLPREFASSFSTLGPLLPLGVVQTVNRELETVGAVLASPLSLAGFRLENVGASFVAGDAQVVIGEQLLRHFALTFDQANRRVRLALPD
jgi:predicted aspartyl protease